VRHQNETDERPAITLDAWIPAAQSCLEKHARWGIKPQETWTLDFAKRAVQTFNFQALDQELKATATRLKSRVANMVHEFITYGIKASVRYTCPNCGGKWGGGIAWSTFKPDTNEWVRGRHPCPRCKNDGSNLQFHADERVAYKPPFWEVGSSGRLNVEFVHNCGIHPYQNDGLVKDYRMSRLKNESKKKWEARKKTAKGKPTVYIVPYSTKEEIKPGDPDYEYWIEHNKKMRTYQWGWTFG